MNLRILVINGPNLNRLGAREPKTYGHMTLAQIEQALTEKATATGVSLTCFQNNHEGAIVERVHQAHDEKTDFLLINPAAFTHTSIAIRDAIAVAHLPFVEIHLSNVHQREAFRHRSYFSDLAEGIICGFGWRGYLYALDFAIERLAHR